MERRHRKPMGRRRQRRVMLLRLLLLRHVLRHMLLRHVLRLLLLRRRRLLLLLRRRLLLLLLILHLRSKGKAREEWPGPALPSCMFVKWNQSPRIHTAECAAAH